MLYKLPVTAASLKALRKAGYLLSKLPTDFRPTDVYTFYKTSKLVSVECMSAGINAVSAHVDGNSVLMFGTFIRKSKSKK